MSLCSTDEEDDRLHELRTSIEEDPLDAVKRWQAAVDESVAHQEMVLLSGREGNLHWPVDINCYGIYDISYYQEMVLLSARKFQCRLWIFYSY
jgi:hypothetical protein